MVSWSWLVVFVEKDGFGSKELIGDRVHFHRCTRALMLAVFFSHCHFLHPRFRPMGSEVQWHHKKSKASCQALFTRDLEDVWRIASRLPVRSHILVWRTLAGFVFIHIRRYSSPMVLLRSRLWLHLLIECFYNTKLMDNWTHSFMVKVVKALISVVHGFE